MTLSEDGDARALGASADLAAYRIVQEALTNVRRHAPGAAAHVRLAWEPGALVLAITDDGPGPPPGAPRPDAHGLVGMAERVRMHGGGLRTGPGPAGGFAVEARLPL